MCLFTFNSYQIFHFLKSSGKFGGSAEKSPACGRLVCDIKISAKELIRCKSYDLKGYLLVINLSLV